MALMRINFFSKALGKHHHFNLILPEQNEHYDINAAPPLLPSVMILHGLSSDNNSYMRFTNAERYANEHNLAAILPDGDHSFYANMLYGHSYKDHILEVWRYAHQVFPLSKQREDNFLAGHSMGGFGVIKTAFENPGLFGKACFMSSATDIERLLNYDWPDFKIHGIIGNVNTTSGTSLDIKQIVERGIDLAGVDGLPDLYMMCGTEDFIYDDNVEFKAYLESKDISFKYEEGPGEHDYAYWDQGILRAMQWMSGN